MLEIITGLPGNAKTLFTISYVKKWAEREGRPVFYSGIPELKDSLGWVEIDPLKWMDVPAKAIVIIDECQKVFRNRSLGAVPGKHVTDLETHRHLGIDLVFITQHPSLIDPVVRRLSGRHRHLVRVWGMEASTVHQWDAVRENCDKPAGRKDSEKMKWGFDKSVYHLYKSADEHTMKRQIPGRVKLLLALPLVLIGAGYVVYSMTVGKHKAGVPVPAAVTSPGVQGFVGAPVVAARSVPVFDPVADAKHFVESNTPRLAGLPQTAPKYDELTKPTVVPVPAACIQSGNKGQNCKCLTQQATPMDVKYSMCVEFARNGYFQDFDPNKDRVASQNTARSSAILDAKSAPVLAQNSQASSRPAPYDAASERWVSPYPSIGTGSKF